MPTPITVRDRTGNITTRLAGILHDGDVLHVPVGLMDAAGPGSTRMMIRDRAETRIVDAKDEPGPYRDMCDALAARSGGYTRQRAPDGLVGDAADGRLAGEAVMAWDAYVERLSNAWRG